MPRHRFATDRGVRPGEALAPPVQPRRPVHLQEIPVAGTRVLRLGAWHGEDGRPTVILLSAGSTDPNTMSVFAERAVTFPEFCLHSAVQSRPGPLLSKVIAPN